jgi:hypothetical protein
MSVEKSTESDCELPAAIGDGEADPVIKPPGKEAAKVLRDPITGQFLPGTARGPGRPHGSKGKLNKTVVDTLSAVWERRGDEVLERLADENPAALAAIVSRLIPSDLVSQAIEGDDSKNGRQVTDITINLVGKTNDDVALPAPGDRDALGIEQAPIDTKH